MKYKYEVINGKPFVKGMPEMEKPHNWHWQPVDMYNKSLEAYNNHIASLPEYPVIGEVDWKEGQELIEGKDFELQKQVEINYGTDWLNATDALYNSIKEKYRRIIAIPIVKDQLTNTDQLKQTWQDGIDYREMYNQWCKKTKRNGGVLVGGSIYEFLDWLESESISPTKSEVEETKEEYYRHLYFELKKKYEEQADTKELDEEQILEIGGAISQMQANNLSPHQIIEEIAKEFYLIRKSQVDTPTKSEVEAIAFAEWLARNNYRALLDTTERYAQFEGRACCSDYFTAQELYKIYRNGK